MSVADIVEVILSDVGSLFLLVIILLGGMKGIWVWGWHYKEMRSDRDQWKSIAFQFRDSADEALRFAERQCDS